MHSTRTVDYQYEFWLTFIFLPRCDFFLNFLLYPSLFSFFSTPPLLSSSLIFYHFFAYASSKISYTFFFPISDEFREFREFSSQAGNSVRMFRNLISRDVAYVYAQGFRLRRKPIKAHQCSHYILPIYTSFQNAFLWFFFLLLPTQPISSSLYHSSLIPLSILKLTLSLSSSSIFLL